MYGPPRPAFHHIQWGYHAPQHRPAWRHPVGPRAPFHGQHQRFSRPSISQPNNDNYWCETCDRGFPTEDILNKHKQQHQKCNIDGCQFIAHPKVITKHIQMQHSTGLYKKIANLKNPEEIEKWREERRKKYPTKANIDKKAAELKEKIDRGEKMGLERNKYHGRKPKSDQNSRQDHGVKRKFNTRLENQSRAKVKRNNPTNNNDKKPQTKGNLKTTTIVPENNKLKPFEGILNLLADSDNEVENEPVELNGLIEDEDDSEQLKKVDIEKPVDKNDPIVCGALASLICEYGSSEEEDNEVINIDSKCSKPLINTQNGTNVVRQKPDQLRNPLVPETNTVVVQKYNTAEDTQINKHEIKNVHQLKDKNDNGDQNNDRSSTLENNSWFQDNKRASESSNKNENADNIEQEKKCKMMETTCTECSKKTEQAELKKYTHQETIQNDNDSDSGPEEVKAEVRKDSAVLEESKQVDVRKDIPKKRMQINQNRRRKLPSTLLQKLLQKEVQQERNLVLQCIRYIRRNNYFENKE